MATSANNSGYGNPGMGGAPWGAGAAPEPGGPWAYQGGYPDGPTGYWRWRYANRPLWIIATLLGLIFWWPVGLILLIFALGGRGMSCWGYSRYDGYEAGRQGGPPPWVGWRRHWKRQMKDWCRGQAQGASQAQAQAYPSSGNRAFDEYRTETLRRLEEEQKEFGAYLDRLRFAKDKAEFDQFMAELRQRPQPPSEQPHA
jgi:hypothetical protein